MPTPVATLQVANPSMGTVSRQPQTTGQAASAGSAPFTRLSRQAQILGPSQGNQAYGSLWTPTLKPVGGYLRQIPLTVTSVTGGTLTGAAVAADAPYNVIQNLFLRDPFGQPVIQASGYSLYLINLYGGQYGMLGFGNNVAAMPSFTTASATTGAFQFRMNIPLEMDSSGYCSLPSMNAASQPQLQIQWNLSTVVFGAHTGTDPTITASANETFWMAPVDHPEVAPPDVGSSGQWSEARAAAGVASGAYQRIQLPRVGTFIHTLILQLRDSTNARIDAWPTGDLTLWVDGVPILFEAFLDRVDKMFTQSGVTRPTGVISYSFRDSVQSAVSTADTYDLLLPTTPATLLEVSGTFGTISNAPATILATTGELFPVGGIPYTHLSY
jgi:hypothetical protein